MRRLLSLTTLAMAGALVRHGWRTPTKSTSTPIARAKLIQPLFDAFTKDTGVKVNVISASSGLEQRIKTEGANSPADVLLTVDISRLEDAVQNGITQPINSKAIDEAVPAQYRDPEGHWAAVAMRARVVYASKERVKQDAITYEELADPKWKGKICIRSGQHMYNNALFAAMIAKHGEAKAEEWLKGLKANLAQKPSGGDRETARDIAAGKCDLGIGNTYYWALMNDKETDKKPWAEATKVILPTFQGGGTHVNLSGVALIKNCAEQGQRDEVHRMDGRPAGAADARRRRTTNIRCARACRSTRPSPAMARSRRDPMPLAQIAANRKKASALVDKVGFDN